MRFIKTQCESIIYLRTFYSIFVSFLKSSRLKFINIVLVSSANENVLYFLLIVFYKSFT